MICGQIISISSWKNEKKSQKFEESAKSSRCSGTPTAAALLGTISSSSLSTAAAAVVDNVETLILSFSTYAAVSEALHQQNNKTTSFGSFLAPNPLMTNPLPLGHLNTPLSTQNYQKKSRQDWVMDL